MLACGLLSQQLSSYTSKNTMMNKLLVVLGSAIALSGGVYLWLIFGTLGQRPWNDRTYTPAEILSYAKSDSICADLLCQLQNPQDLRSDELDAHDPSRVIPLYRVFNAEGRLLRQHCCFESIPGFLDSTVHNPRWATAETEVRLPDFLRNLALIEAAPGYKHDSLSASFSGYTVLYYWDTTLRYNIEKLRTLIRHLKAGTVPCRIISINYNRVQTSRP